MSSLESYRGNWALITGASSGIGFELALQFAQLGMHLVLVAGNGEKLLIKSQTIREHFDIQILAINQDLSELEGPVKIYERLSLEKIKIRILINNAGIGQWGAFSETPLEKYQKILLVNNYAVLSLCRLFLEDLKSHSTSRIINLSSPAAYQPVPFMAVYAASKSFLQSFSLALYQEFKGTGLVVQCIIPGPTDTDFDSKAGAYQSALKKRKPAKKVAIKVLLQLNKNNPAIIIAEGTYLQRFFNGVFPIKLVLNKVAKMFKPGQL